MSSNSLVWLRAPAWAAIAGAVALFSADAALAQECADDGDCDDGYACTAFAAEDCPTSPPCSQGDEACQKRPPPECAPRELKRCAPAPCDEDSDCPESMLCHTFEMTHCSGAGSSMGAPPCTQGEDCATPEEDPAPEPEPDCEVEPITQCTPRYTLPCTNDDDCGDGFKCEEEISVSCAGSSGSMAGGGSNGTPAPDPGDEGAGAEPAPAPTPEDGECESEPTGNYYCKLQVVQCDVDDDCPADFECVDNPNRAECDPAAPKPGESGGADPADACGDANDGLPEKTCLPRHYYESGGFGVDEDGVGGEAQTSDTPSGSTGTTGADKPKGDHAANSADAGVDADSADGDGDDNGCAVAALGASHSGNTWSMLGLLSLCALALRKRLRQSA